MKLISAFLLLTGTLATADATDISLRGSASASASSLSGWGQFKCMVEAFSDAEKCSTSVNDNNEPCAFCTMKDPNGGEGSGLCVDPTVAPQMEQINPNIDCSDSDRDGDRDSSSGDSEEEEDIVEIIDIDYHDFKCSIKAFNNPNLCKHTKTDGGEEHCEYCTVKGPFGESGICVSPEHAAALEGYNPDVKCDGDGDGDRDHAEVDKMDVDVDGWSQFKCTLNLSDEEKCAAALNDEGQSCAFCVIEDPSGGDGAGLCVDPSITSQMESINPAVSCNNDPDDEEEEKSEEEDVNVDVDVDYHDFKCSIQAFVDPDTCAKTMTNGGVEHCQYCSMDGPFGKQGLCVSPDHAAALKKLGGESVDCDSFVTSTTM